MTDYYTPKTCHADSECSSGEYCESEGEKYWDEAKGTYVSPMGYCKKAPEGYVGDEQPGLSAEAYAEALRKYRDEQPGLSAEAYAEALRNYHPSEPEAGPEPDEPAKTESDGSAALWLGALGLGALGAFLLLKGK